MLNTGSLCCVGHYDKHGRLLPSCVRCAACHHWIRPNKLKAECPGPDKVPDELQPLLPGEAVASV